MCIGAASQFLNPQQAEGSFNESEAIDTRAISLANNVTADPPGIMSVYYNPAGLSNMGDGTFITLGATLGIIKMKTSFDADPNFQGFNDLNGNKEVDPLAGTSGTNKSERFYIPIFDTTIGNLGGPIPFGISYRSPGSKFTYAYSIYVPYIGGWDQGSDNPARYDGETVYVQHLIYAAPTVSYRIDKTLSVGASLGLGQTALGINTNARMPNQLVNVTKLLGDATQGMSNPLFDQTIPFPLFGGGLGPYDQLGKVSLDVRDDFSPSYNLGVLWEPFDWLAFGLNYQSAIKSHLSGKYTIQYSDKWQKMVAWEGSTPIMQIVSMVFDLPYQSVSQQTGTVTADMEWPQIVNFGIKLKPVKRLSLLADLHWSNWSSIKQDNFTFDQSIQLLQLAKYMGYSGGNYNMVLQRDFKDTLNWGVAMEFQALDWLTLRAGYENRVSSTAEDYYDLLYAVPTVDYYGAGFGIKGSGLGIKMLRDIDVDLAVGYMVNKSYKIMNNGSSNLNSTVLGNGLLNSYSGLNVEEEFAIYLGSVKATMPLDIVTNLVYTSIDFVNPFKKRGAKGRLKTTGDTMNSPSPAVVDDHLRVEGQSYFTEDSE
jgi:long-subunit fatty acid transport protein